eukprot:11130160-Lingulodinium_polyedra.AAC.1
MWACVVDVRSTPLPEVPALIEVSVAKSGRVWLQRHCRAPVVPPSCLGHLGLIAVGVEIVRGK